MEALLSSIFSQRQCTATDYVSGAFLRVRPDILRDPERSDIERHAMDPMATSEEALMRRLLNAPQETILIRGGTGSGKSSTLQYTAQRRPANVQVHVIDLQQADPKTRGPKTPTQEALDTLYDYIATAMRAVRFAWDSPSNLARCLHSWTSPLSPFSSGVFENVRTTLRNVLSPGHVIDEQGIARALSLLSPYHRLVGSLLPILRAAGDAGNADPASRCLLVLDNLDPVPTEVQNQLILDFATIANTPDFAHTRIVLPVRLSTFYQHSATQSYFPIAHDPPDVAQLATIRTLQFLFAPEAYQGYLALEPGPRDRTVRTLTALATELLDKKGRFSSLLSAISGTNIRNGFASIRSWCMDHYRGRIPGTASPALHEWQQELRQLVGNHLLAVGTTIATHLVRKAAEQVVPIDGGSNAQLADIATVTANDLAAHLIHAFRSLVRLSNSPALEPIYRFELERAMNRASSTLPDIHAVKARYPDLVAATADSLLTTRHHDALTTTIQHWLVAQLRSVGDVEPLPFDASRRAMHRWHGNASRFRSVSRLFAPNGTATVLNLYRTYVNLRPLPLRVLYMLASSGQGLSGRDLWLSLLDWGYEDRDIKECLSDLVDVNRRLIFSTVSDQRDGIDVWFQPDRPVHIAPAGLGYLREVAVSVEYLQWALVSPTNGRAARMTNEKWFSAYDEIIEALSIMVDDETRQLQALRAKYDSNHWIYARRLLEQPAVADVLFRALPGIAHNLHSLANQRDATSAAHTAERFLALAKSAYTKYHQALTDGLPKWRATLEEFRGSVSRLI